MKSENIVIGVEGMVSSGKTSMCKELVKLIPNTIFIDAGYIYRGIVMAIRENNIDLNSNTLNAFELMEKLNVKFEIEDKIAQIYINGKRINEKEIETIENSIKVSEIASTLDNNPLFIFSKKVIDNYKTNYNVIVSGRSVVDIYPEVDIHLFVTASLDIRAKRRYEQYNKQIPFEEIKKIIQERDELHEKAGFNKKCEVTRILDLTDCNSPYQSALKALEIIKKEFNVL